MNQPMKPPAPPRVGDIYLYWTVVPPEVSRRCIWWLNRINNGWRPNSRIMGMGYADSSRYYGVYVWEYINILQPHIDEWAIAGRTFRAVTVSNQSFTIGDQAMGNTSIMVAAPDVIHVIVDALGKIIDTPFNDLDLAEKSAKIWVKHKGVQGPCRVETYDRRVLNTEGSEG